MNSQSALKSSLLLYVRWQSDPMMYTCIPVFSVSWERGDYYNFQFLVFCCQRPTPNVHEHALVFQLGTTSWFMQYQQCRI